MTSDAENEGEDWAGIWDRENPGSVWSRVPVSFRLGMDGLPERLRLKDEKWLRKHGKPPQWVQNSRMRFWELFMAHPTMRISIKLVFNQSPNLYQKVLDNPKWLMFLLSQPEDVSSTQKVILEHSMDLVRGTLKDKNLYTTIRKVKKLKDGSEEITETRELNVKALAEVRKIMAEMTDRVHGGSVQKVAHAHVLQPADPLSKLTSVGDILAIANEPEAPDMLKPGEKVEKAERLQNDLVRDVPVEAVIESDLHDLMSDE